MKPEPAWDKAIAWVRKEMRKRALNYRAHRSFLAAEVLKEAETKFDLQTCGVEGWASETGDTGVQYLNTGDSYAQTIYIRSWHHEHKCSLGTIAGLV